jgi:calcium-dependent protein kinase
VWSCGVILYILLIGRPPFDGETDDEILENVSKGIYKIKGNISPEGVDLIKKMLTFDPDKRISASAALTHQWIIKNTELLLIEENFNTDAMKNLKDFRAENKLQ